MKQGVDKILNASVSRCSLKYIAYVLCGVILAVLTVLFAFATKNLVNSIEFIGTSAPLALPVAILVIVVALSFIFSVLTRVIGDGVLVKAETNLKKYVFNAFITGDYSSIKKVSSGDLLTRIEGDVITVSSVRVNLLPSIISTAVRLVGTVVALFILQPVLTIVILIASLLLVVCSFFVRKIISKLHLKSRKTSSELASYIAEANDNSLAVKAFGAENYIKSEFSKKLTSYEKAKLSKRYFNSGVASVISLAFTAFYATAVIFGVIGMKNGVSGLTFGSIIASLQLLLQIKAPVTGISGFFTANQEMLASAERLSAILTNGEEKIEISNFEKLEVENAHFSYGDKEVLKGVNLTVTKGDKIVIKGASGEGKTTLIELLAGLYIPSSGSVTVYGDTNANADKIKGLCSFVPQGNMIFSGSLKENVVFNKEYDEARFKKALNASKLDVESFKDKENYQVGVNGVNLSEGQAQRLALARALYLDNSLLVLDEPTSALDVETEDSILKELFSNPELTIIMITHKPSAEKYAEKIYTFSGGKLI